MRTLLLPSIVPLAVLLTGCTPKMTMFIELDPAETRFNVRSVHRDRHCALVTEPDFDYLCPDDSPDDVLTVGYFNDHSRKTRGFRAVFGPFLPPVALIPDCVTKDSNVAEVAVLFDFDDHLDEIGRGGTKILVKADLVLRKISVRGSAEPNVIVEELTESWEPGCNNDKRNRYPEDFNEFWRPFFHEGMTAAVRPGILSPLPEGVDGRYLAPGLTGDWRRRPALVVNVTKTVRDWVAGRRENHGFLFRELYLQVGEDLSRRDTEATLVFAARLVLTVEDKPGSSPEE